MLIAYLYGQGAHRSYAQYAHPVHCVGLSCKTYDTDEGPPPVKRPTECWSYTARDSLFRTRGCPGCKGARVCRKRCADSKLHEECSHVGKFAAMPDRGRGRSVRTGPGDAEPHILWEAVCMWSCRKGRNKESLDSSSRSRVNRSESAKRTIGFGGRGGESEGETRDDATRKHLRALRRRLNHVASSRGFAGPL